MVKERDKRNLEWSTAISDYGDDRISIRGYRLADLIRNLSFAEVLYLTIRGELPTKWQARVMEAVLCSIVDHGISVPTILAARVIASTAPTSIMPSIAGALLTVGSTTVSPQDTAELIEKVLRMVKEGRLKKEEAARGIVKEYMSQKKRIPGLGNPFHPSGDPRAIALKEVAVQNGMWGEKGEIYEEVAKVFVEETGKSLPINIDGMMGCVLSELGFESIEMAGIAAISFMPGIIAHAVEENRAFKVRGAAYEYTGLPERKLPT